eukprot:TRINITY_DN1533_c0_g1_i1.p1 TRINITY_DN1533_c0_g1~~TRINITY_DN1533_c0_g1_i1.p1  ORF type:complete len:1522 (+),score=246.47 TRINITY_DN1533_c0_g1_i1:64-4629(+)
MWLIGLAFIGLCGVLRSPQGLQKGKGKTIWRAPLQHALFVLVFYSSCRLPRVDASLIGIGNPQLDDLLAMKGHGSHQAMGKGNNNVAEMAVAEFAASLEVAQRALVSTLPPEWTEIIAKDLAGLGIPTLTLWNPTFLSENATTAVVAALRQCFNYTRANNKVALLIAAADVPALQLAQDNETRSWFQSLVVVGNNSLCLDDGVQKNIEPSLGFTGVGCPQRTSVQCEIPQEAGLANPGIAPSAGTRPAAAVVQAIRQWVIQTTTGATSFSAAVSVHLLPLRCALVTAAIDPKITDNLRVTDSVASSPVSHQLNFLLAGAALIISLLPCVALLVLRRPINNHNDASTHTAAKPPPASRSTQPAVTAHLYRSLQQQWGGDSMYHLLNANWPSFPSRLVGWLVPSLMLLNAGALIWANSLPGATASLRLTEDLVLPNGTITTSAQTLPLHTFDLGNSVRSFWDAKAYVLAVAIAGLSGAWPYLKILCMLCLWLGPLRSEVRYRLLWWLDFFGRWSLVDYFFMETVSIAFQFHMNPLPLAKLGTLTVDIIVVPRIALYLFFITALGTILFSNLLLYIHNKIEKQRRQPGLFITTTPNSVLSPTLIAEPGQPINNSNQEPLPQPLYHDVRVGADGGLAMTPFAGVMVGMGLVVAFVLMVVGFNTQAFEFTFSGLAGEMLGNRAVKRYSLVSLIGQLFVNASEAGMYFLATAFLLLSLVVPLTEVIVMAYLWCVPMPLARRRVTYRILDRLNSWTSLDVFLLCVVASLVELPLFSTFIVGDKCDAIDKITKTPCFESSSSFLPGVWLLVAGSVLTTAMEFVTSALILPLIHPKGEVGRSRGVGSGPSSPALVVGGGGAVVVVVETEDEAGNPMPLDAMSPSSPSTATGGAAMPGSRHYRPSFEESDGDAVARRAAGAVLASLQAARLLQKAPQLPQEGQQGDPATDGYAEQPIVHCLARRWRLASALAFWGVCLVALGLSTPAIQRLILSQQVLPLTSAGTPAFLQLPTNASLRHWAHQDGTVRYHLWNLTNPDAFLQGQTANFTLVGPFEYRYTRQRVGLTWNRDQQTGAELLSFDETVSFEPVKTDQEENLLSVVNYALLSVMELIHSRGGAAEERKALLRSLNDFMWNDTNAKDGSNRIVIQRSAGDLLRGADFAALSLWVKQHLPSSSSASASLGAAISVPATIALAGNTPQGFGVGPGGAVTTGGEDLAVRRWNGSNTVGCWGRTKTSKHSEAEGVPVRGTDGTRVGVSVVGKVGLDDVPVFSPELARPINYTYWNESDSAANGLRIARYGIAPLTWVDGRLDPPNLVYEQRLPSGVLNETACRAELVSAATGVFLPQFVGTPHFLNADPSYTKHVSVSPVAHAPDHATWLDFDLQTGLRVGQRYRWQAVVPVRRVPELNLTMDLAAKTLFLPVYWVEDASDVNGDLMDRLRWSSALIRGMQAGLVAVGITVLSLVGVLVWFGRPPHPRHCHHHHHHGEQHREGQDAAHPASSNRALPTQYTTTPARKASGACCPLRYVRCC